ncbi:MAG TPA: PucR family transcriptional regulator ligand-binding domain-containing protein, partial [Actinomycetota bacterium]
MTTTVADLLDIGELHLGLVAGAGGLDRPIRWAHVSELEDPTRFLRGGEVLLTTGFAMRGDPASQAAYVEGLAKAELAALGVGLGFAFEATPPAVLDAADQAGFPVFEVPFEVPFIAITEALFSRLVNEQYVLLQRAGTVQQTLSRLLVEGAGLDALLEAYARMTGTRALLLDVRGEVMAAARGATVVLPPRAVWAEIQALRPEGNEFSLSLSDEGGSRTLLPVLVGGGPAGFLVLHRGSRPEPFHQVVVHHLATAVALELSKAQAVARTERRLVGDFLDALLEGELSASEIRRRLRFLGLGASPAIAVLVARGEDGDRSELAVEALRLLVQDRLSRRPAPYVCSIQDASVVALFEAADPAGARAAAGAVAEAARARGLAGRFGLGMPEADPRGLRRAYQEARFALEAAGPAQAGGPGAGVATVDDLG